MKIKIYLCNLIVVIIILISGKTYAQGVGNHLTMSLENCSYPALNIIQFDLIVTSDGASFSDIRPNSFEFGINFDTCILQSGATTTISYVIGTKDSIFPDTAFDFLPSAFRNHLRIVQQAYTGGNPGVTMIIGHECRFGTFQLTSSANYTNCCPHFSLQVMAAGGHTLTGGYAYLGSAAGPTVFDVTGTGDGQRAVKVTCTCINGIDENNPNLLINFYPNPATDLLHISLDKNITAGEVSIYNVMGEKVYSERLTPGPSPKERGEEVEINCRVAAGVYFVQVRDEERVYTGKIVIE